MARLGTVAEAVSYDVPTAEEANRRSHSIGPESWLSTPPIVTCSQHLDTRSPTSAFQSVASACVAVERAAASCDYARESEIQQPHEDADTRANMQPSTRRQIGRSRLGRQFRQQSPRAFYWTLVAVGALCLLSFVSGPHQARRESGFDSHLAARDIDIFTHTNTTDELKDVRIDSCFTDQHNIKLTLDTVPPRSKSSRQVCLCPRTLPRRRSRPLLLSRILLLRLPPCQTDRLLGHRVMARHALQHHRHRSERLLLR